MGKKCLLNPRHPLESNSLIITKLVTPVVFTGTTYPSNRDALSEVYDHSKTPFSCGHDSHYKGRRVIQPLSFSLN